MAIVKTEGIFGDMVVLNYNGSWYGIPMSQIVQIESAQKKYGLNTANSKLIEEGILPVNPPNQAVSETSTKGVADMVVELHNRIDGLLTLFPGFKQLLDAYPAQWSGVLTSTL